MAFSMKQFNVPKKKNDLVKCYALVAGISCLTPSIRVGLNKYLEVISRTKMHKNFTFELFEEMVHKLLEGCCNKQFIFVRYNDVSLNESAIIYHIKDAIIHQNSKTLFYEEDIQEVVKQAIDRKSSISSMKKSNDCMSEEDAIAYFNNLEVI